MKRRKWSQGKSKEIINADEEQKYKKEYIQSTTAYMQTTKYQQNLYLWYN